MRELAPRAVTAFYRAEVHRGVTTPPPVTAATTVQHGGTDYVVLRTTAGRLLAVYRLLGNGRLRRQQHCPAGLEAS